MVGNLIHSYSMRASEDDDDGSLITCKTIKQTLIGTHAYNQTYFT